MHLVTKFPPVKKKTKPLNIMVSWTKNKVSHFRYISSTFQVITYPCIICLHLDSVLLADWLHFSGLYSECPAGDVLPLWATPLQRHSASGRRSGSYTAHQGLVYVRFWKRRWLNKQQNKQRDFNDVSKNAVRRYNHPKTETWILSWDRMIITSGLDVFQAIYNSSITLSLSLSLSLLTAGFFARTLSLHACMHVCKCLPARTSSCRE